MLDWTPSPSAGWMTSAAPRVNPADHAVTKSTRIAGPQNERIAPRYLPNGADAARNKEIPMKVDVDVPARVVAGQRVQVAPGVVDHRDEDGLVVLLDGASAAEPIEPITSSPLPRSTSSMCARLDASVPTKITCFPLTTSPIRPW